MDLLRPGVLNFEPRIFQNEIVQFTEEELIDFNHYLSCGNNVDLIKSMNTLFMLSFYFVCGKLGDPNV